MNELLSTWESVLNWRLLGSVLFLVAMVFLVGFLAERNKRAGRGRPGQYMLYEVPGKTAAACRGMLARPAADDLFAYTLEGAPQGGWYLNLKAHPATEQPLDTVFLLSFEDDEPARFSLRFVSEIFGQKEPVVPEEMLDEFFLAKLGARRVPTGT